MLVNTDAAWSSAVDQSLTGRGSMTNIATSGRIANQSWQCPLEIDLWLLPSGTSRACDKNRSGNAERAVAGSGQMISWALGMCCDSERS
jgi:hypothetical protein